MKYLVTVIKDIYEETIGVEVAGVFDTEEKAYEAKVKVAEWLKAEGFEDFKVFVSPYEMNRLTWYEIDEQI